jgi:hypothetical protein
LDGKFDHYTGEWRVEGAEVLSAKKAKAVMQKIVYEVVDRIQLAQVT